MQLVVFWRMKLAVVLTVFSVFCFAAGWSETSLLLLHGNQYKKVPSNDSFSTEVLTLEHNTAWQYGHNFFFFDITDPNSANSTLYGEFSPSLSLSKISGYPVAIGDLLKDVRLTGTWELGEKTNSKLWGLGIDLNIPGLKVLGVNFYKRYSETVLYPGKTSDGFQVTIIWKAPFKIGSTSWVFEGFLDHAFEEQNIGKTNNIVSQPRLTMDIGDFWGAPKKVFLGIEYSYWMNKFGVDGINENNPQLALKWSF